MRVRAAILMFLGATSLCLGTFVRSDPASAASTTYRVIVHPDNPAHSIQRTFLANAFLKKVTKWPDGETINPVDRDGNSETRREFAEQVLDRSLSAVRSYWQQMIFSGRGLPPPELESDDAIVRYVVGHRGAVGYVSGDVKLAGVKALAIE